MDTFIKDPEAVLDYKIDWAAWLLTDTISASSWQVDNVNIIIDSDENNDTEAVVWLSSGSVGESYIATNHIVTAGGREDDRSIKIKMKQK